MRFVETTSEIPDELIDENIAGQTVFLCGAGISFLAAKLPMFKALTERIYLELGETFENDAPEREAFEKAEYDRTLRALEKRLHRPGTEGSPVRIACANQLKIPDEVQFEAHFSVLTLSKDREGRPRVLTTNFDTIFERAARNHELSVQSEAGKALPKPGARRDHGIHHLHGRLADSTLSLLETDLILTSADFGDAYLRDGWASRYIEDRMRTSTLVLIGYRAEDAALRLLLETLDVDRERFPDLKKIYALEKSSDGSAAQWRAKGVIPIEFGNYHDLYNTLAQWAKYAERPADFGRSRITEVLAKAPEEATEFEKSQLKFFLDRGDINASLTFNNPSLSWLPVLAELRLVGWDDRWLASWIERNLADPISVTQIVESIGLFGPGTADLLEYRLNRCAASLPEYLVASWSLIIRHMRNAKQGFAARSWYDLLPKLNKGDRSADTIDRLTAFLKPDVQISKRFNLYEDGSTTPASPSDLMSIGYEPEDDISIAEVAAAWSADTASEADERLLLRLCHAIDAALDDAVEIGIESNTGYGTTDSDVPSVAEHAQNAYRTGFLPIVRVTAEIWTRLADKDAARALPFVERWRTSSHRLNHRLALFASAHSLVSPELAGKVLLSLPIGEFFLTGGTVEVYRLLKVRWSDFASVVRDEIELRVRTGPPADWFRAGADVLRQQDRSRYDLIGNLERDGIQLSVATRQTFDDIVARWPDWSLRPAAQAGFHSWSESGSGPEGDADQLEGVSDEQLVATALQLDAEARFGEGQTWYTLCQVDPDRALRGLEAVTELDLWRTGAWQQLISAPMAFVDAGASARITQRLLAWPDSSFPEIAMQAISWLEKPEVLALAQPSWQLWDKIFSVMGHCAEEEEDTQRLLDSTLIVPVGRLTGILLRKIPASEEVPEFVNIIKPRLEMAMQNSGKNGLVARVRMAAEVAYLFERVPVWTTENILPLFDWNSPDADAVWCARRYARYIGGPELFALTKAPFLQLFGRVGMPEEAVRVFAGWLVSILIANQKDNIGYALTSAEARAALRRTNADALKSVAHSLAIEMQAAAPVEKMARWRDTVSPVFQGIWPRDVDLQSGSSTFKLLQILRATGNAFPEAVDVIIPFIQPEARNRGTSLYSLSNADEILYTSAPAKMLDLASAAVGPAPAGSVGELRNILDRIRAADPALADTHKFQALAIAASAQR